jgi:hypothetical protein
MLMRINIHANWIAQLNISSNEEMPSVTRNLALLNSVYYQGIVPVEMNRLSFTLMAQ